VFQAVVECSGVADLAVAGSLVDYKETLLFLATAGVVAPLFRKLKINSTLGFILAGVAVGPHALGALAERFPALRWVSLTNVSDISHLAEFGVVFLLFMIGLELSFERLSLMKRLVFGLGAVQVGVCAALIALAAWIVGAGGAASAVIGGALALSSTAIVIPVLAEKKRLGSAAGRVSFSVLLFQDLAVAPLLVMVAMLSGERAGGVLGAALTALLPAAIAMVVLVAAGRVALRPMFHLVAATGTTEFFVAACLLVVLAAALAAASAGLSMGLGAFVAGLLLAETEFRREIEVTIEPFQGLLLGLYFLTMGASLDLSQLFAAFWSVAGVALGLIAMKAGVIYLAARGFGVPGRAAREAAMLLGPGGEFAFVMLGSAMASQIVPQRLGGHLMLAVALSMMLIPALAWGARRWSAAGAAITPPSAPGFVGATSGDAPAIDGAGRVIVVGHGRVGQLVCDMLGAHKIPTLIIDEDPNVVAAARKRGLPIYWGNATRPEFLRKCDLAHARALVVTINSPRRVEDIVGLARAERGDLTIVARARDAQHASHLYGLGATDAIPETIEASLQLSEAVLVDVGVPMGFVIASIHEKRDEYRKMLQPSGDAARERRDLKMSHRVKDMAKRQEAKAAERAADKAAGRAEKAAEKAIEKAQLAIEKAEQAAAKAGRSPSPVSAADPPPPAPPVI
jgi:CPA2 family monovalent cation:H+ antiporter-2